MTTDPTAEHHAAILDWLSAALTDPDAQEIRLEAEGDGRWRIILETVVDAQEETQKANQADVDWLEKNVSQSLLEEEAVLPKNQTPAWDPWAEGADLPSGPITDVDNDPRFNPATPREVREIIAQEVNQTLQKVDDLAKKGIQERMDDALRAFDEKFAPTPKPYVYGGGEPERPLPGLECQCQDCLTLAQTPTLVDDVVTRQAERAQEVKTPDLSVWAEAWDDYHGPAWPTGTPKSPPFDGDVEDTRPTPYDDVVKTIRAYWEKEHGGFGPGGFLKEPVKFGEDPIPTSVIPTTSKAQWEAILGDGVEWNTTEHGVAMNLTFEKPDDDLLLALYGYLPE